MWQVIFQCPSMTDIKKELVFKRVFQFKPGVFLRALLFHNLPLEGIKLNCKTSYVKDIHYRLSGRTRAIGC
jgi:hypothetical protein